MSGEEWGKYETFKWELSMSQIDSIKINQVKRVKSFNEWENKYGKRKVYRVPW